MSRGALTALAYVSAAALALAGRPAVAAADVNDVVIARLATRISNPDGSTSVVGQNREFRALTSQLGVVLAPELLTPADTLGFGGFQLDVTGSQTTIDSKQAYWRARAGSPDPGGTAGGANGPGYLRTIGFFAHKGMWFPLPSFELGAGAVHLVDSNIWTGQLYAKLALHEGYHDLPIPSVAVRGAVSRMMNQRDLDLTIASIDVTISKHFGIGGTWRFDPFVGWNLLLIVPRSQVLDATPEIADDDVNNFVFHDQSTILRHRIFGGAKFQYYVFQFTAEVQYALAGTSLDDQTGTNTPCAPSSTTARCDAKDTAAAQTTVTLSAGVDF
ncbi:MAG TPA: hypothetical protein VFP84_32485 [Kofleriaceae bacterium]|nr:hypothetical protein [Kofleriaceae bacterium]